MFPKSTLLTFQTRWWTQKKQIWTASRKIRFWSFSHKESSIRWGRILLDKCQKLQVSFLFYFNDFKQFSYLWKALSKASSSLIHFSDPLLFSRTNWKFWIILNWHTKTICLKANTISVTGRHPSSSSRQDSGVEKEEDVFVEEEEETQQKSAPTTPEMKHRTSLAPIPKVRHHSVANQSPRKISYKDETLKFREHNLFSKKVPKDAEAANIQVWMECEIF